MSDKKSDTPDPTATPEAIDDTRKEWIAPVIEELPVNESQGSLNPSGPDAGLYT